MSYFVHIWLKVSISIASAMQDPYVMRFIHHTHHILKHTFRAYFLLIKLSFDIMWLLLVDNSLMWKENISVVTSLASCRPFLLEYFYQHKLAEVSWTMKLTRAYPLQHG